MAEEGQEPPPKVGASIARRLMTAAAIWTVLVLLAGGASLQGLYRSETLQRLDADIDATLLTLISAVDSDDQGGLIFTPSLRPNDERFQRVFSGRYWAFVVLASDQSVVHANRSRSFFDVEPILEPEIIREAVARPGDVVRTETEGPDGARLRVGMRTIRLPERSAPILLYAAIDRSSVNEEVGRFTARLALALGVLALGLVAGVFGVIRFGLRPLNDIEDKLEDIRSGRRDRLEGVYPRELASLVREINTLIGHNRKIVERARTHVGNLAHALKTPLAVLMNEAGGPGRLNDLVRRQTEAMTASVNHYLRRARAAAQAEVLGVRSDVAEAIEPIARMLERLYRDKGVSIEVQADLRAVFRGERGDLDELVGNVLENAAKWCKRRVTVCVERTEDGVEIRVDDDGPGLAPDDRRRALERGGRLDESEPGTGLGLSIVSDLTEIYGGRLSLEDSPLGGLRVRLELPAAPL
ncbi:MAG: histidine kinase [Alphaproteobacteria bacterium]|nr:histidine kinase [Alphaproteobacteria bacterium]